MARSTPVHYEAVNAMLLNEFLKAHQKLEAQEATIAELKSTVAEATEGNGSSDRTGSKSERATRGKQASPATNRK